MSHRGSDPSGLVQAVIGCSQSRADLIVTDFSGFPPGTDLLEAVDALFSDSFKGEVNAVSGCCIIPREIKSLCLGNPLHHRFVNYLYMRGCCKDEISWMIENYVLCCALSGWYKDRVIVPITDERNGLVGWVGRAISSVASIRYLTSHREVKHSLFGGALLFADFVEIVVVTEGVFDALKINWYSYLFSKPFIQATCFNGKLATREQIVKLLSLAHRGKKIVLALDHDAFPTVLAVKDRMMGQAFYVPMPHGSADPGGFTVEDAKTFFEYIEEEVSCVPG